MYKRPLKVKQQYDSDVKFCITSSLQKSKKYIHLYAYVCIYIYVYIYIYIYILLVTIYQKREKSTDTLYSTRVQYNVESTVQAPYDYLSNVSGAKGISFLAK
jgi:hypothetical protein